MFFSKVHFLFHTKFQPAIPDSIGNSRFSLTGIFFYSPSGLFVEICKKNTFGSKKIGEKFVVSKINRTFASLLKIKPSQKEVWRDGRVVDYSGLENRRAERHRGFESLSLRSIKVFS